MFPSLNAGGTGWVRAPYLLRRLVGADAPETIPARKGAISGSFFRDYLRSVTQMANTVVILGLPGSGKGTQSKLLAKNLGFVHFDLGEVFRKKSEEESELGEEIRKYVGAGKLVPLPIVRRFIEEFLSANADKDIVLDGFPRSVEQAYLLDELVRASGRKLDAVIFLDLQEEPLRQRILNRLVCKACGAIYNAQTNPPKHDLICDECGDSLETRIDDSDKVLVERLKVYKEETSALLELYRERDNFFSVDASKSANEIEKEILRIIS